MHDRADQVSPWAAQVRTRRRLLGLTQTEVAELAGVADRTVHAVEAGKPTVRLDALTAVLDAVGLRLEVVRAGVAHAGVERTGAVPADAGPDDVATPR